MKYLSICIFVLVPFVGLGDNFYYKNISPQWVQNMYSIKGENIKGDVFSVTTISLGFRNGFGTYSLTGNEWLKESTNYDKTGNLIYRKGDDKVRIYEYKGDTIKTIGEYGLIECIVNKKDSQGRLEESIKLDKNNKVVSKINFTYNPQGYEGIYWPSPSTKVTFIRKGNIITGADDVETKQFEIDGNGNLISETFKFHSGLFNAIAATAGKAGQVDKYKYDSNGNLIQDPKRKYEYIYDSEGNWIEKKEFDSNGTLRNWFKRIIEYKTPEEWAIYEKEQIEAEKLLNQEILKKASEKTTEFIVYKLQDFLYDLDRNQSLQRSGSEIKDFDIKSDLYAFTFPDGTSVDNIKFDRKDIGYNSEKFISENNSIVLYTNFSSEDGLNWYIIKFDSEFNPMRKVDWIAEYNKEFSKKRIFGELDDHNEDSENKFYNDILYEQWEEFCNVNNSPKGFKGTIYKIEEPYETGFISPDIADKDKEKELLETWKSQKEFDDRLDQILKLIATDEKEIAKIKKFKVDVLGGLYSASNVWVYSFKLNDNIDHNEITINSIGADKRLPISKHNNNLRGFLDRNELLVSEDGNFAIFVADRGSWWNTKKPVLVFDLKNNIVNFISGKDWDKIHTHR